MTAANANLLALALPSSTQVVWAVLLLLTTGLVVLLRTRLRDVRPWCKCALLSLWAHVLLAGLAMTLSVISGRPGVGPDAPIRVTYIAAAPNVAQIASESAPPEVAKAATPLEEPTAPADRVADAAEPVSAPEEHSLPPEVVAPSSGQPAETALDPAPLEPLTAPDLVVPPTPNPKSIDVLTNASEAENPRDKSLNQTDDETSKRTVALPDRNTDAALSPIVDSGAPHSVEPLLEQPRRELTDDQFKASQRTLDSAAPHSTVFARRFSPRRSEWLVERGGNGHTERSVKSALAWLAGAQGEQGLWIASRFGAGEERVVLGHDRKRAGAGADCGVTGLALLAFLGAGNTHRQGDYTAHVQQGLDGLRRVQRKDGSLFGDASFFAQMYCHSMATFALAEAYAITGDASLQPAVEAAVKYSLRAQSQRDGGWRYKPGDSGDTSQLGWQLMALKSAELAGLPIPESSWTASERFLREVQRGAAGGLAAYRPDGPPSRTMTAEAIYCRQLTAQRRQVDVNREAAREAVASILRETPGTGEPNLYYWYYATLALSQARDAWPDAQQAWETWNSALVSALLDSQNSDGSWPTTSVWGGYGGRVYTTAMAAMTLEVYYRYDGAPPRAEIARTPSAPPAPRSR